MTPGLHRDQAPHFPVHHSDYPELTWFDPEHEHLYEASGVGQCGTGV